ncbi:MAG: TetR/AcrR family transcriptional regulator [Acidimicrobiia bacterium]|nr:TetR/AcrR family transcriptional regulator [Acidimicrobiia bacterium]
MASGTSRRQAGTETRDKILTAALARFTVESYRGASVRDLADDVGVTQPVLYYHFGSKDGILAALIEPLLEAGEQLVDELGASSLPPDKLAVRALEGYYDVIVDHLAVFQLVETDKSVRSHPQAGHRLADQAARFLALLAGSTEHEARLRAAAAIGAIRRSLSLPDVRPGRDRRLILACAAAALSAEVES